VTASRALLASVLLAACVGAEHGGEATPAARSRAPAVDSLGDEPPHAIFGCLQGDSAVYADVRTDPTTGDTIGVWLTFWRAGNGVDGIRVLGEGGRADTTLFTRVQLVDPDSIAFDVPTTDAPDTTRFLGRVACNRLWGRQRERRDVPSRAAVYWRTYERRDSSGGVGIP
jgi:hypothetical protein